MPYVQAALLTKGEGVIKVAPKKVIRVMGNVDRGNLLVKRARK